MTIFLVGYAGSGKSSLGRRLARHLGCRFVDTDKLVEQMEGATIAHTASPAFTTSSWRLCRLRTVYAWSPLSGIAAKGIS